MVTEFSFCGELFLYAQFPKSCAMSCSLIQMVLNVALHKSLNIILYFAWI